MNEIFELDLSERSLNDTFVFMLEGFRDGARLDDVECQVKDLDQLGDMMSDNPGILSECFVAFVEDMKNMTPVDGESKKK